MSEKKSIIELLGITQGPWWCGYLSTTVKSKHIKKPMKIGNPVAVTDMGDKEESFKNAQLIAAAPEMLVALIDRVKSECEGCEFHLCSAVGCLSYSEKQIIEKACEPLSWPEIKEIINAE